MANENDQNINNVPDGEIDPNLENSDREIIPLWLQGLDETGEDEDLTSTQKDEKDLSELDHDADQDVDLSLVSAIGELNTEESDLPDWLNEFSHADSDTAETFQPEDIDQDHEVSSEIATPCDDNGFIEIPVSISEEREQFDGFVNKSPFDAEQEDSGLEETNSEVDAETFDLDYFSLDVDLAEGDELPPWMKEMIDEPIEVEPVDGGLNVAEDVSVDESTQPVILSDENLQPDEIPTTDERSEILHSLITARDLAIEDEVDDLIDAFDTAELLADAKEIVDIPPTSLEDVPLTDFNKADEVFSSVNNHFVQGSTTEALRILEDFVASSIHLDKVEAILEEASMTPSKHSSEIWEMLGDVAVKGGNYEKGLNAYTKAIEFLFEDKDGRHGAG
ncbi:MAG: hypothetical protein ACOX7C_10125 [Brevefilum sp.]|jgi:hypothetical protein